MRKLMKPGPAIVTSAISRGVSMYSMIMVAIARGALPSARAIVSATLLAASPCAGSFGASIATVAVAEPSLPEARARSIAAPRIDVIKSFIGDLIFNRVRYSAEKLQRQAGWLATTGR